MPLVSMISREQFLDVVNENWREILAPTPTDALHDVFVPPGKILLAWRKIDNARISLPELCIADRATQEDLFSWSATYLRELTPISSMVRFITPEEWRYIRDFENSPLTTSYISAVIGMAIGETYAHSGRIVPTSQISVAACLTALSYAIGRAYLVSHSGNVIGDLPRRWLQARSISGHGVPAVKADEIADIGRYLYSIFDRDSFFRRNLFGGGDKLSLERLQFVATHTMREVGLDLPIPATKLRTAEERVLEFDVIAPQIVSNKKIPRKEKAYALGMFAAATRSGSMAHASLLMPFVGELPESTIWFCIFQGLIAPTATMMTGNGLGWRIARELIDDEQIFSRPKSDLCLSELEVLNRSRSGLRSLRSLVQGRLSVELAPAVYSLVRTIRHDDSQLPLWTSDVGAEPRSGAKVEDLDDVERLLELGLRGLKQFRLLEANQPRRRRRIAAKDE
jgi:hypothetical protein